MKKLLLLSVISLSVCISCADVVQISSVNRPDTRAKNVNYVGNREPLQPAAFIKLPMGAVKPQLVGASGDRGQRQLGVAITLFQNGKFGHRGLAVGVDLPQ